MRSGRRRGRQGNVGDRCSPGRSRCMPGRSGKLGACGSGKGSGRTKEMKSVMISYGRTPPDPTIPSRTTLPGIQVLARRRSTPRTGAVSSPSGKDHRLGGSASAGSGGRRWREVRRSRHDRVTRAGSGMRRGKMTSASGRRRSVLTRLGNDHDSLTRKKTMRVTMGRASISRFDPTKLEVELELGMMLSTQLIGGHGDPAAETTDDTREVLSL
jgi:hypothetical protein